MRWPLSRFQKGLLLITLVGLALRIAYVLIVKDDQPPGGDAFYYHWQARLLADGKGFMTPLYKITGATHGAADHPPLYIVFLAIFSFAGLQSFLTHKILSALLGTVTVWVMGLLGRDIAGPRVGWIAAGVAALYPNFWLHDGMVMSETITLLTVAWAALSAYRLWREPSLRRAMWFGVAGGLAALAHPDSVLILPFAAIPIYLGAKQLDWRQRFVGLAVVASVGFAVMAPWFVYNFTRFEKPVLLSTGLEITMVVSNCDETYHGEFKGFWWMPCASSRNPPVGDPSVQADYWREIAFDYIGDHRDELPGVVLSRLGRTWQLWRPSQSIELDIIEGHETWVSRLALGWYWTLLPMAIAGAVILKRRRVPISPLVSLAVIVTIASALTFGNTRYRASAEVAVAALAAVTIGALFDRARDRHLERRADVG